MLPATISNNVPGTDLSIGADTALNAIVEVSHQCLGQLVHYFYCKYILIKKVLILHIFMSCGCLVYVEMMNALFCFVCM